MRNEPSAGRREVAGTTREQFREAAIAGVGLNRGEDRGQFLVGGHGTKVFAFSIAGSCFEIVPPM